MVTRRRTLAALVLVAVVAAVVLADRGTHVLGAPAALTLDGQPLEAGAHDVSPRPALAVVLPPGSTAEDFAAALDGHPVAVVPGAGRAAHLQVGALPQGSHHVLEVWRGAIGPARVSTVSVAFDVAAPLQLAATWLAGPTRVTVQVSASRELADPMVVESALVRAGAVVRHDDRGVEGRWPGGRSPAFSIPAGLRATTGAYLAADFSPALGAPVAVPASRVDFSQPPGPMPVGLRLRAYYVAGPAARASLAAHASRVAVLSPSFYTADAAGNLSASVDEAALAIARSAGVKVEPLVTNRDFSPAVARGLFTAPAATDNLATALVAEAARRGYAGYQLDFEGLGYGDRSGLSGLSRRLYLKLSKAGLQYSTAVIPSKTGGSGALAQLFGHSGVYDYTQLARDSTSMSVMAYDQHTAATDPGPVAGLDWVRQVTEASLAGVDRGRVEMGIPLYYRDWPLHGQASAGAYRDEVASVAAHDGTISWDFAAQGPYARYRADGDEHVAWMENAPSLLAKLQLAHQMGFGGVATWRIGFEDPAFWDLS